MINQSRFKPSAIVVTAFLTFGMSIQGHAWEQKTIERGNWVPNVGELDFEAKEQPLGDMWTFVCPPGGTFKLSIDTKDDTDINKADIDPVAVVLDGRGNEIGYGDDEIHCKYEPVCGYGCPSVEATCGKGEVHSILVRDYGTATTSGDYCQEGGGYKLGLEVRDVTGRRVPAHYIKLGGGARRNVPGWALKQGIAPVGPALDDEILPNPSTGVRLRRGK